MQFKHSPWTYPRREHLDPDANMLNFIMVIPLGGVALLGARCPIAMGLDDPRSAT